MIGQSGKPGYLAGGSLTQIGLYHTTHQQTLHLLGFKAGAAYRRLYGNGA
jgi:hypothetical protein